MKLEVGMYVRFDYHRLTVPIQISKIEEKHYEDIEKYYYYLTDNGLVISEEQIIKASNNIIDLIEVGDILEIEYFSLRYEKRVTRLFEVTYKEGRFINLDNAKCQFMLIDNDWTDNDKELEPIIKSIVTKEMYSSVEYRLGD